MTSKTLLDALRKVKRSLELSENLPRPALWTPEAPPIHRLINAATDDSWVEGEREFVASDEYCQRVIAFAWEDDPPSDERLLALYDEYFAGTSMYGRALDILAANDDDARLIRDAALAARAKSAKEQTAVSARAARLLEVLREYAVSVAGDIRRAAGVFAIPRAALQPHTGLRAASSTNSTDAPTIIAYENDYGTIDLELNPAAPGGGQGLITLATRSREHEGRKFLFEILGRGLPTVKAPRVRVAKHAGLSCLILESELALSPDPGADLLTVYAQIPGEVIAALLQNEAEEFAVLAFPAEG